jgi:tRNA-(ms[2]io[6]A)-hydroxylase
MDEILLDHCHLEKKAASTALNFIFRYPDQPQLMQPLSELAREELEHFELVLEALNRNGVGYGRIRPSPYAGKLLSVVREREPERLLDGLLCCAFIEARSCERMKLLSESLPEGKLADLYASLLASEARHHRLYLDLAETVTCRSVVRERCAEVGRHEAGVARDLPKTPRLHNR